MAPHLKFLHHFGEMLKNIIQKKFPQKKKKYQNAQKKYPFLKRQLKIKKFIPINSGLKNLKNTGSRVKSMHQKN